jgi:hypothetical protein
MGSTMNNPQQQRCACTTVGGNLQTIGMLDWIKRPVLQSAKSFERLTRRVRDAIHPEVMRHRLHWHMMTRRDAAKWTAQRLQLDGYYWLFILGLNNSGTTLLVDLLKSHPAVRWLPNEGQYLTGSLPLPRTYGVPRKFAQRLDVFHWTEENDSTPALRIQYDWAMYYQQRPGILMEKSPPNIMRSRWLQHNFRPSRFLAITRHPYAVCEGIRRREGHTIEEAARHWTVANAWMLEDIKHLDQCLFITYEELCSRPQDYLTQLQAFLGLEVAFDPKVVAKPRRIHSIDNTEELIRNFNARSLQQLSASDVATIDRITGPLMQRLGYARAAAA